MKKLSVLPTLLACALGCAALTLVGASLGARSTDAPASVAHTHPITSGVSDPDPTDCPFCGGNPQVHIRALWSIEKQVQRALVLRLL